MDLVKLLKNGLFILLSFLVISCGRTAKDYEGKTYKIVKIGNQIWMAENLNVSHFRNGDSIPEVRSAEEWIQYGKEGKPAWCYMDNIPENGKKYGKLYNWFAQTDPRGLAPKGWHAASDDEWTQMVTFLGGGVMAALQLRKELDLTENSASQAAFNGLPAGCRNTHGAFYGTGTYAYWWSTTEGENSSAWMRMMNYADCDIFFLNFNKSTGASVRCIRN